MSFVVKLSLSQILIMLFEFIYFVFTTINIYISQITHSLSQNIHFKKNHTGPITGPKLPLNGDVSFVLLA